MKTLKIIHHKSHCWSIADVYEDHELIHTINKFYKIDDNSIYEYDAEGGSGIGFKLGDLIWKYCIKDCNFIRIED
jgi:hypothetical protein